MAKSIIRRLLLGINFLRKNDIVHGDIQPGNLLFSVKNLSNLHESELAQSNSFGNTFMTKIKHHGEVGFQYRASAEEDAIASLRSQEYSGGEPTLPGPSYIIPKEPMFNYVDLDPPLLVKLSDLGGAFFEPEPPAKPVTPLALRSPELVLGEPISKAQDVWSFGCLIFEFLTARMLFSVVPLMRGGWSSHASSENENGTNNLSRGLDKHSDILDDPQNSSDEVSLRSSAVPNDTAMKGDTGHWNEDGELAESTDGDTDDDHVLQMATLLGPIPSSFMAKFPRSNIYFDSEGNIIKGYVGDLIDEDEVTHLENSPPTERYLDQEKGDDITSEDAIIVKELLRLVLQFDPTKRPTTGALLAHPWFMNPAGMGPKT